MTEPTHPPAGHRFLVASATVGIVGWLCLMLLLGWWYLAPANLPTITQPLPVLNANHEIAVGEPIVVQLDVVKPVELEAHAATRYIACQTGNLVTLTSSPTTLPTGAYTIVSDSVELPAKVSVGEVCTMNWRITYTINPVRDESLALESEPFTVVKEGTP